MPTPAANSLSPTFVSLMSLFISGALAGCSGQPSTGPGDSLTAAPTAAEHPADAAPPGTQTSGTSSTGGSSSATGGNSGTTANGGGNAHPDASSGSPPPPPPPPLPIGDGGAIQDGDAAVVCPNGTTEIESNDDAQHATLFKGTVCGAISPFTDVDFLRFDLPANAQNIDVTHSYSGSVRVTLSIDGKPPIDVTGPVLPNIPVAPNKAYLFRIDSPTSTASSYRLVVNAK